MVEQQEELIRTRSQPSCPVCSEKGNLLYQNLEDHLFKTPGFWNVKKCENLYCATLWLDPTPTEEDLQKIYTNYHTHTSPFSLPPKKNFARDLLETIRGAYLYKNYNYEPTIHSPIRSLCGLLSYLHPAWRDAQAANIFYLPAKKEGLLLDVGCGNGSTIQMMAKKGWKGVGIDFDDKAVEHARSKGLEVKQGDIFSQKFRDASFDAIILSHVIEHVPSPIRVLTECRRIMKEGGSLIAITPNARSRGYSLYRENWRGLEIPRHLQVFTPESLSKAAKLAGFRKVKSFTSLQGVLYLLDSSKQMAEYGTFETKRADSFYKKIVEQIRWFVLGWAHLINPNVGEVTVIMCEK